MRHLEFDVEYRCVRRRKKSLLDLAEGHDRPDRDSGDRQDDEHAGAQRHPEETAIGRIDEAAIGILGNVFRCPQKKLPEIGCDGYGEDPAHQQRNRDNREQREQKFAGGIWRQSNSRERHDPDHGGPKQRKRCRGLGIGGGVFGGLAPRHANQHAFGDHDGVVDQHTHGDDQCPETDPFHLDAEDRHEKQRGKHR